MKNIIDNITGKSISSIKSAGVKAISTFKDTTLTQKIILL